MGKSPKRKKFRSKFEKVKVIIARDWLIIIIAISIAIALHLYVKHERMQLSPPAVQELKVGPKK